MAEVISADLRNRILNGELLPGDSLFSESQLMETYEVSRPTLREALRLLEAQNLITVRRGSHRGPIVSLPDITIAAESVAVQLQLRDGTLADVYDFRSYFEPRTVEQATKRMGSADIAELRRLLEHAHTLLDDIAAFSASSYQFHQAVLEMSGNATAAIIAEALGRICERLSIRRLEGASDALALQRGTLEAHARAIEFFAAGDASGARSYWAEHMDVEADAEIHSSLEITLRDTQR
ncbi:MAG: pdhR 2 [Frankiales bacterium]|nr:pdhR 2 [Frankiales bacterium]